MKKLLIVLVALLALQPGAQAKKEKAPARITAMSFNIRLGTAQEKDYLNGWVYRQGATPIMLQMEKPDVVGIQEAYRFQLDYILVNRPEFAAYGVGRDDGKEKGEIMAVLYRKDRLKLLKKGTFWLSETPDVPSRGWDAKCRRTATWALFQDKSSGKRFYFVNTHLDHRGKEARAKGLSLIVDRIQDINPKGYPMVLTGDFNVRPDNPCLQSLEGRMESAREIARTTDHKGTFTGFKGEAVGFQEGAEYTTIIDYIYVSDWGRVISYKTLDKPYGGVKFISDHFPIKAVLEF